MMLWKVLTLAETTDEADLRRTAANKMSGPYVISWYGRRKVAVLLERDIEFLLSAFDVIDRKLEEFFRAGGKSYLASTVWDDFTRTHLWHGTTSTRS